jgi:hypothetical protein
MGGIQMTDDIVTRLRDWSVRLYPAEHGACMEQAADEVERLRQKEFMWKTTAVKLAGKMLPFSLLMSESEREEIQIVLQEAINDD